MQNVYKTDPTVQYLQGMEFLQKQMYVLKRFLPSFQTNFLIRKGIFTDVDPNIFLVDSEVWSVRDDAQMRDLADATGGIHVPLGTSVVNARKLWRERLAPLVGGTESMQQITKERSEWRWFAVPGLVLLGFGSLGRPRIA